MKNLLYIGNQLSKHGSTLTSIETLGALFEKEGYVVFYASSKKNKVLRFLDMLWKTFSHRKKIDYVVIDTYSTSNFWYAFAVSQLSRILSLNYIPILRGGDLPNRLDKNPKLSRMIFNNSYKNVAPSKYLMHHFAQRKIDNVVYIPNTIELENYTFKLRKHASPKLLWVRAFAGIYNPKMAVDVLVLLKAKYENASLCMVGPEKDGSLEITKQYARQKNVPVKFTGRLSKKEWRELSEDYDIFINTTHFDNTPVSVIEAMALGLPVVTTNVGGIPFLLENKETALLVEDANTAQMANAVTALCNDGNSSAELSANGRLKVEDFDWQTVRKAWYEILR